MKFTKPIYNAQELFYSSNVIDGISIERKFDETIPFSQSIQLTEQESSPCITAVLEGTKGWFSKPLTLAWLTPRLRVDIPVSDIESDFEGTIQWQFSSIKIYKQNFDLLFTIVKKVKEEKICISLEEDEEIKKEEIPQEQELSSNTPPTRRQLAKDGVMKARNKAARALFKAERLTQEYIASYGENTDWEDSDAESIS